MKKVLSLLVVFATLLSMIIPVAAQTEVEEYVEIDVSVPDFYNTDELFAAYAESVFYPQYSISLWGTGAGERLNTAQKGIYDAIKADLPKIANGTSNSPQWTFTSAQLKSWGVPTSFNSGSYTAQSALTYIMNNYLSQVVDALLADCPYELYWFDKTDGWRVGGSFSSGSSISISSISIGFRVVQAYAPSGYDRDKPTTDTTKTGAVSASVANAQAIRDKYASLGDYEKLTAYKDEICGLVSYNDAAAENSDTPYGDPWQLVYVFDKDTSTNVVCEGYSKAFQYLCDISNFQSAKIECYSVSGDTTYNGSGGGHMWNIVTMDDGKNYLADITNSDSTAIGNDGELFLKGVKGSLNSGYYIQFTNLLWYTYDSDTQSLWGTDSNSILMLSTTDYEDRDHVCVPDGNGWYKNATEHWKQCECSGIIDNGTHIAGEWVTITSAELGIDGYEEKRCTVCDYLIEYRTTPAFHYTTAVDWETDYSYHWKECDCGCGKKFHQSEHTGEWITVIEPDLGDWGYNEYRCTVCNYLIASEDVPSLHYTTATTWETDSEVHYKECDCGCGLPFEYGVHNGQWKTVTEAKLGESGLEEKRCITCNYLIESREIPAQHYSTATKWTSNNYSHWKECDCGCGKKFEETVHDGEFKVTTPPQLGVEGTREKRCEQCQHLMATETVPALHYTTQEGYSSDIDDHYKECDCGCGRRFEIGSHVPGQWKIITEPKIGVEGKQEQRCNECNYLLATETIPALKDPTLDDGNQDEENPGGSEAPGEGENPGGGEVPGEGEKPGTNPGGDDEPQEPLFVRGDVNKNNKIDSRDYLLLKRAYFGTTMLDEIATLAADVNKNGKIDSRDYMLLKRAYFGTYTIEQ